MVRQKHQDLRSTVTRSANERWHLVRKKLGTLLWVAWVAWVAWADTIFEKIVPMLSEWGWAVRGTTALHGLCALHMDECGIESDS